MAFKLGDGEVDIKVNAAGAEKDLKGFKERVGNMKDGLGDAAGAAEALSDAFGEVGSRAAQAGEAILLAAQTGGPKLAIAAVVVAGLATAWAKLSKSSDAAKQLEATAKQANMTTAEMIKLRDSFSASFDRGPIDSLISWFNETDAELVSLAIQSGRTKDEIQSLIVEAERIAALKKIDFDEAFKEAIKDGRTAVQIMKEIKQIHDELTNPQSQGQKDAEKVEKLGSEAGSKLDQEIAAKRQQIIDLQRQAEEAMAKINRRDVQDAFVDGALIDFNQALGSVSNKLGILSDEELARSKETLTRNLNAVEDSKRQELLLEYATSKDKIVIKEQELRQLQALRDQDATEAKRVAEDILRHEGEERLRVFKERVTAVFDKEREQWRARREEAVKTIGDIKRYNELLAEGHDEPFINEVIGIENARDHILKNTTLTADERTLIIKDSERKITKATTDELDRRTQAQEDYTREVENEIAHLADEHEAYYDMFAEQEARVAKEREEELAKLNDRFRHLTDPIFAVADAFGIAQEMTQEWVNTLIEGADEGADKLGAVSAAASSLSIVYGSALQYMSQELASWLMKSRYAHDITIAEMTNRIMKMDETKSATEAQAEAEKLAAQDSAAAAQERIAAVMTQIAAEAAVQAVMETAKGVATALVPGLQAESAAHFTAAGIFAGVAGVAGAAASAIQGSRGKTREERERLEDLRNERAQIEDERKEAEEEKKAASVVGGANRTVQQGATVNIVINSAVTGEDQIKAIDDIFRRGRRAGYFN